MMDDDVPLALYAAVVAALGEGYLLAALLEHEGMSIDAWEAAEERWVLRLQESAEGDLSLFDALDRAMAEQRARFSRVIEPLDDDLEQFLAFQRHLSAAAQPTDLLTTHGLFLGDWVRLQERWAERLAADASARARGLQLLSAPEMPPLPAVRPGPRMLPPPLRTRSVASAEMMTGEAKGEALVEWGLADIRSEPASPIRPARS
ncbi:hypothetical protein WME94_33365 [Sorangium sp. So ce429]